VANLLRSRVEGATAVLKHFQARMPCGLVVPDVDGAGDEPS
jgi:hypothetical protein